MAPKEKEDFQIYNVGSNRVYSVIEVLETMKRIANFDAPTEFIKGKPSMIPTRKIDSFKIYDKLGWQATTKLEDGLANAYEWYLEHKEEFNKYKNSYVIFKAQLNDIQSIEKNYFEKISKFDNAQKEINLLRKKIIVLKRKHQNTNDEELNYKINKYYQNHQDQVNHMRHLLHKRTILMTNNQKSCHSCQTFQSFLYLVHHLRYLVFLMFLKHSYNTIS